jgi:NADP-dependent 3-hydroxy acid dehydrogenase YdfG
MSEGRLEGKVAIVTGAAGGIGAAAAARLAQEGALLVLTDANEDGVQRVADELGGEASVRARAHDVTSEEQWQTVLESALEAHGQADILVNNAGVFLAGALTETSLEDFKRVMEINVTGVFLGMRTVAPAMTEQRAG